MGVRECVESAAADFYAPAWEEDAEYASVALEGLDMRGVKLYHFYHLGSRIHPLGDVETGMNRAEFFRGIASNREFFDALLVGAEEDKDHPFMRQVRGEGLMLSRTLRMVQSHIDTLITDTEALDIKTTLRDFERAFSKALNQENVFHVRRVGIYETSALIEHADEMFLPETRNRLSDKTRADWRAAGRCLAFELGTAAGFHTVRATESVIHEYYVAATGDAHMKRKDRNWGAYVRNLNRHRKLNPDTSRADPKLIALIDSVREHHRNPVMHPEDTLTPSDAYALFNVCQAVIVTFSAATAALPVGFPLE